MKPLLFVLVSLFLTPDGSGLPCTDDDWDDFGTTILEVPQQGWVAFGESEVSQTSSQSLRYHKATVGWSGRQLNITVWQVSSALRARILDLVSTENQTYGRIVDKRDAVIQSCNTAAGTPLAIYFNSSINETTQLAAGWEDDDDNALDDLQLSLNVIYSLNGAFFVRIRAPVMSQTRQKPWPTTKKPEKAKDSGVAVGGGKPEIFLLVAAVFATSWFTAQ